MLAFESGMESTNGYSKLSMKPNERALSLQIFQNIFESGPKMIMCVGASAVKIVSSVYRRCQKKHYF